MSLPQGGICLKLRGLIVKQLSPVTSVQPFDQDSHQLSLGTIQVQEYLTSPEILQKEPAREPRSV